MLTLDLYCGLQNVLQGREIGGGGGGGLFCCFSLSLSLSDCNNVNLKIGIIVIMIISGAYAAPSLTETFRAPHCKMVCTSNQQS